MGQKILRGYCASAVQGKEDIHHQSSEKHKVVFQKCNPPCKDLAEKTNYMKKKEKKKKEGGAIYFF